MRSIGWELIAERDKQHRELNERFGYAEPNGTFGIGRKSHVDLVYKRLYDDIEAQFRQLHDQNYSAFDAWCRSQGMTIFEFLFFDNIYDEHLEQIVEESLQREDWQFHPVQARARLLVKRLKVDHNVGEIRKRLDFEIANQSYASSRCRKFFALKAWDLLAQKAIWDYGGEWKDALNSEFSRMTVV